MHTSSAAYLSTAVNGASSGTLSLQGKVWAPAYSPATYTLKGSFGSDVRVILKVTLDITSNNTRWLTSDVGSGSYMY